MKLYNSYTNQLEEFKPITKGQVNMYVCGPTVYNHPHIGNGRPIIVFDTLKKTFEALGYKVKFVSNFTDVDDKIIIRAKEEGIPEKEFTEKYIASYNQDRQSVNADLPDITPRVTETMTEIIDFIADLVEKKAAYVIDGDVYFRVSKINNYGTLSKQKIEDLMVGARIDENSLKENPLDFTLWKATNEGINWQSPWSKGRPGWHTECVVMIMKEFGSAHIDIHGGGLDLKFPHHENEIAQSEVANHTHIANYWIHNGMMNMDGMKMSKSLGNVILIADFVKGNSGNVLRWATLGAHYRAPLNMSDEVIENAKTELNKILTSYKQGCVKLFLNDQVISQQTQEIYDRFLEAMADDLNTPNAMSAVFDCVKQINSLIRQKEIEMVILSQLLNSLEKMLHVLGIKYTQPLVNTPIKVLYSNWEEAKTAKDFEKADTYRQELIEKGIL